MPDEEAREITPGKTEIAERRLSKLERVREQLKANKDVFFAGEIHRYPSLKTGYFIETIDIIVAPIKPIYDYKRLNEFMDGLIPGIKRSAKDAARDYRKGGIHLGRLYFDEVIGTKRQEIMTHIETSEPEVIQKAGMIVGESRQTKEEKIKRRTWVRVYPDVRSAQIIAEYEQGVSEGKIEPNSTFNHLEHYIEPEQLKKLKRNQSPFARIAGLLKKGT